MDFTITNVGLLVPDVQKVVSFYKNVFNLSMKQDFPEFVEFESDGPTLFLWQWSHLEEFLGKETMKKVTHPFMAAIYFDSSNKVDEAYKYLLSKGVDFLTEPKDWPWNARAAYFVDPGGYIWEIYTWIHY